MQLTAKCNQHRGYQAKIGREDQQGQFGIPLNPIHQALTMFVPHSAQLSLTPKYLNLVLVPEHTRAVEVVVVVAAVEVFVAVEVVVEAAADPPAVVVSPAT